MNKLFKNQLLKITMLLALILVFAFFITSFLADFFVGTTYEVCNKNQHTVNLTIKEAYKNNKTLYNVKYEVWYKDNDTLKLETEGKTNIYGKAVFCADKGRVYSVYTYKVDIFKFNNYYTTAKYLLWTAEKNLSLNSNLEIEKYPMGKAHLEFDYTHNKISVVLDEGEYWNYIVCFKETIIKLINQPKYYNDDINKDYRNNCYDTLNSLTLNNRNAVYDVEFRSVVIDLSNNNKVIYVAEYSGTVIDSSYLLFDKNRKYDTKSNNFEWQLDGGYDIYGK